MEDWLGRMKRFCEQPEIAVHANRAALFRHVEAAIRQHLMRDLSNAVEYPDADYDKGMLVCKPGGSQLVRHVWGTMLSRPEPYEGVRLDDSGICFYIGPMWALIVSDRDDTPAGKERIRVFPDGKTSFI